MRNSSRCDKEASQMTDSLKLDSPAFDAKSYYDQLIITSSLGTLLKRENALQSGETVRSILFLLLLTPCQ